MRIAHLLVNIYTAIIIVAGGWIPLTHGIVFCFADALGYMIAGLDPLSGPARTFGGPILLFPSILLVLNAVVILILAIPSFILSKKLHFKTGTAMYVSGAVISTVSFVLEIFCTVWLNTRDFIVGPYEYLFIWLGLGGLGFIATIVLTVLNVIHLRKECDFRDMLEDMRTRNGQF